MTKKIVNKMLYKQPLSVRGILALILSYIAVVYYAIPEHDLVAYVLGGGAVLLITFLLPMLGCYLAFSSRRISLKNHIDSKNLYSNSKIQAGIHISNVSLSPLFNLKLERVFLQSGVKSSTYVIRGKNKKRNLVDEITFPHRGLWDLKEIKLTLSDVFGLTRYAWTKELTQQFEISAKPISIAALPLVISSAQSGDQINDHVERSGDLYDIKAYDPSDGTKHILWKTYAKSGQLVVRRPEPAVIPEGEVALYLVAKREDDDIAAALLDYTKQLEENNILTLFSTDGLNGEVVEGRSDTNSKINESVWDKKVGTGKDFRAYLENLSQIKSNIRHILVFSSRDEEVTNQLEKISSNFSTKISVILLAGGGGAPPLRIEGNQYQNSNFEIMECKRI